MPVKKTSAPATAPALPAVGGGLMEAMQAQMMAQMQQMMQEQMAAMMAQMMPGMTAPAAPATAPATNGRTRKSAPAAPVTPSRIPITAKSTGKVRALVSQIPTQHGESGDLFGPDGKAWGKITCEVINADLAVIRYYTPSGECMGASGFQPENGNPESALAVLLNSVSFIAKRL